MTDESVCLTLIVPHRLRDEMFDYLAEQSDVVSGFTALQGSGHGAGLRLPTAAERVKGHADQIVVQVVLPATDARRLLDRLRASFAGTNLVYWTVPVTEHGTVD